MPHDVFISHSSTDKLFADAACHALEAEGIRCWVAPRDVMAGLPYASQLTKAIADCKVTLLLLSHQSNHSTMVLRELEIAADKQKPILPVRLDNVDPSDEMRFFVGREHWLDALTPERERVLAQVVSAVRRILSFQGRPQPASATTTPDPSTAASSTSAPVPTPSPPAGTASPNASFTQPMAPLQPRVLAQQVHRVPEGKPRSIPSPAPRKRNPWVVPLSLVGLFILVSGCIASIWIGATQAKKQSASEIRPGGSLPPLPADTIQKFREAPKASDRPGEPHRLEAEKFRFGRGVRPDLSQALRLYIRAADAGNELAMTQAGILLARNVEGLPFDPNTALHYFRQASLRGDLRAKTELAIMHHRGLGLPARDDKEAQRLIRQAADGGDGKAMAVLGEWYHAGTAGLSLDSNQSMEWIVRGASTGDGYAMAVNFAARLGKLEHFVPIADDELPTEMRAWMAEVASSTDPEAAGMVAFFQAGIDLDEGRTTIAAFQRVRQLAASGSETARVLLASALENGILDTPVDHTEALDWYRRGADARDPDCLTALGRFHQLGFAGLTPDESEAVRWYRLAADLGDAPAMLVLGEFHVLGKGGLSKSEHDALPYLQRAADMGEPLAMGWMGLFHAEGLAKLPADDRTALVWFTLGAAKQDVGSKLWLAKFHLDGRAGLPKNRAKAIQLYREVALTGNEAARRELKMLGEPLDPP
jgi:TPR repeat protein